MHAYSCAHSRLHTRSYACILVAYSWHTCAILVRLGVCSRQSLSQVDQTQGLSQEDQTLAAEVDAAVKNGNAAVASFDATNKRRRPIDEILQARGLRLHPLATVEPGAGRATIAKANLGIKATLNAAEQICSDLLTHSCILVSAYCAHTRQPPPLLTGPHVSGGQGSPSHRKRHPLHARGPSARGREYSCVHTHARILMCACILVAHTLRAYSAQQYSVRVVLGGWERGVDLRVHILYAYSLHE